MTAEAEAFWRDYSEKLGEQVLRFSLGRYQSGIPGLSGPLWGLLIVTDAGLRFHHFPHENWIAALTRIGGQGGETPAEKTFFIPKDRIVEARLLKEPSFFKRLLSSSVPRLVVRYRPEGAGADAEPSTMAAEVDRDADQLAAALTKIVEAS
jgi:hypothetical protein